MSDKVNGDWLQAIAEHNSKIHSLANLIELVDQDRFEKEGVGIFVDTAKLIHELTEKIHEVLKQVSLDSNESILQENPDRKDCISFTGGTHNHYYNPTG